MLTTHERTEMNHTRSILIDTVAQRIQHSYKERKNLLNIPDGAIINSVTSSDKNELILGISTIQDVDNISYVINVQQLTLMNLETLLDICVNINNV